MIMTQRKYTMPMYTSVQERDDRDDRRMSWGAERKMTWMTGKLKRHLCQTQLQQLVSATVAMALLVITYRMLIPPENRFGVVRSKKGDADDQMNQQKIKDHLGSLVDTRPAFCDKNPPVIRGLNYSRVSILLDFRGDEFHNLKLTLTSIVEHTDENLYGEILVIDDSATESKIFTQHTEFFSNPKFKKVKLYESKTADGKASSRAKLSKITNGSFLVFVDTDVVVNEGWLKPLIQQLYEEPQTIAVPHQDNLLSDERFVRVDDRLVNVPTWMLSTVHMQSDNKGEKTVATPVMRGNILAIQKTLLESLKNYDHGISTGGGHDLELSFRAWLCEGGIKIVLCSRVAVFNTLKPLVVENSDSVIRIAEIWMGDYKDLVYKQRGIFGNFEDDGNLRVRKSDLRARMSTCRNFDWYLSEVVNTMMPSPSMQHFGKFQTDSLYCLRRIPSKAEVDVEHCRVYMLEKDLIFEMTNEGFIHQDNMCLAARTNDLHLVMESCQVTGDGHRWRLLTNGQLQSIAYPDLCATHITETDDGGKLHNSAGLTECSSEKLRSQTWTVVNF